MSLQQIYVIICFSVLCEDAHLSCLYFINCLVYDMSFVMRKSAFYLCENKDADQVRGDREADQHLCFRYIASTIPLLPKYKIASL